MNDFIIGLLCIYLLINIMALIVNYPLKISNDWENKSNLTLGELIKYLILLPNILIALLFNLLWYLWLLKDMTIWRRK